MGIVRNSISFLGLASGNVYRISIYICLASSYQHNSTTTAQLYNNKTPTPNTASKSTNLMSLYQVSSTLEETDLAMTPLSPKEAALHLNTSGVSGDERDVTDIQYDHHQHSSMDSSGGNAVLDDKADIIPNGSETGTIYKTTSKFRGQSLVDEANICCDSRHDRAERADIKTPV